MTGTDVTRFTHKSVPVIFEPPCIYVKLSQVNPGSQPIYYLSLHNGYFPRGFCTYILCKLFLFLSANHNCLEVTTPTT